jgi:transposase
MSKLAEDSTSEEEIPPDVYFCPECMRPFTKLGEKLRHIASEHPDRDITAADEKSEIQH